MTPTAEQLAILSHLSIPTNPSLIVEAVAGSGKTTTICWVLRELNLTGKSSLFLAFNKDAADSLKTRDVPAATFHSHGYATIRRNGLYPKVNFKKLAELAAIAVPSRLHRSPVCRLVSAAKNLGKDLPGFPDQPWESIACRMDLPFEDKWVPYCNQILARSVADTREIDFDDMLYWPLAKKLRFDKINLLFVDEAQDTNAVRRKFLHEMLAPLGHGKLCAVGDPHQAIYGFTGADHNAIAQIREEFAADTLPLSTCWRCSVAVVEEAKKILTKN